MEERKQAEGRRQAEKEGEYCDTRSDAAGESSAEW
jgi:hypothetical protein